MKKTLSHLVILLLALNVNAQEIYEIFGGGGIFGSPWRNDYVVISGNPGTVINNWSLHYASANSSTWTKYNIPNGTKFNSNGFVLVLLGSSGPNGSIGYPAWCTPSVGPALSINADGAAGKFLLNDNTDPIFAGSSCPGGVDFVPYGITNCSNSAASPSNTTAIRRVSSTGDPSVDFAVINSPLPVVLKSFNVVSKNNKVAINWSTSSEQNCNKFDIERSADAERFDQIGNVKGAGTSFLTNSYSFIDDLPLSGKSYYRLKQVDNDGGFEYSQVRTVELHSSFDVNITPSVTQSSFNIIFGEPLKTDALVNLIAISSGQSLYQINIPADTDSQIIPVDNLPAGTYFVHIQNGQEVISKIFVKVD